jgi:hypothetical protein
VASAATVPDRDFERLEAGIDRTLLEIRDVGLAWRARDDQRSIAELRLVVVVLVIGWLVHGHLGGLYL